MKRTLIAAGIFSVIAVVTVWVAFASGSRDAGAAETQAEARQHDAEAVAELLRSVGIQPYSGPQRRIDFDLENLAEESRSLSDYRGRLLFLNFWATWCPPCIEEMPSMQRLSDQLLGEGLTMVAVNVQEGRDDIRPFVDELGLTFEILLDRRGQTGQAYGVRGLPTTVLLDRQGYVLGTKLGFAIWDDPQVVQALRDVLQEI
ncbi:MAG: TlpA family protein disulfide reductase [Spirochaetaceae bacterium]|nr:MAG: TlpA family protein disulfide reductase [Spirochaetaceae bacterium]